MRVMRLENWRAFTGLVSSNLTLSANKINNVSLNQTDANCSENRARAVTTVIMPGIDLGFAKIEPFDPASITRYPTFKDPSRNLHPGTSLCKLGSPFPVD